MKRPYTICHIFSALDGAITGDFMKMSETIKAREQYGELRNTFESNAILYGTTTMLDFCDGYLKNLPKTDLKDRTDYIASTSEDKYVIAIDAQGMLAYSANYLERHGSKQHIIVILTNLVTNAYLQYLRDLNISYIIAGENTIDCELAMNKLYELFGIKRLIIAGGGYTDWAFADAGMIDELSLVLAPAADGDDKVTVFERSDSSIHPAIAFTLKEVKSLEGNAVWLRYSLNNVKK